MNKKISFPIAIAIIIACSVLTGLLVLQYKLIPGIRPGGFAPKAPVMKNYRSGEIVLSFHEYVSKEEAISLVESYNLPYKKTYFPDRFVYKCILSGEASFEDLREEIEANKIVVQFVKDVMDSNKVIIYFNYSTPKNIDLANKLIDNYDSLEVVDKIFGANMIDVTIPKREEDKWIKIFEDESIV